MPPVQRCPFCGEIHPETTRFCPRTGQSLPSPQAPKQRNPAGVVLLLIVGLVVIAAGLYLALGENSLSLDSVVAGFGMYNPEPGGLYETPANTLPTKAPALPTEAPEQPTATTLPTPTHLPTAAPTQPPAPTPTQAPAATATAADAVLETSANQKDNAIIVWVPPGEFLMGSDPASDPYFWGAEAPAHKVTLSGYWIYQYEVTNAMYAACVEEQACPTPEQVKSRTRKTYYNNPQFASFPVVFVDWTSAQSYCRWAGGGLPTEAQWEKAARGEDGRLFPWGQTLDSGDVANLCDSNCPTSPNDPGIDDTFRDTAPVGSFPPGRSPYGLYDAAGNAWEWVFDYFQETYYQVSPLEDPPGPNGGKYRVIRGGSFDNATAGQRAVVRYAVRPDIGLDTVGFRCAMQER